MIKRDNSLTNSRYCRIFFFSFFYRTEFFFDHTLIFRSLSSTSWWSWKSSRREIFLDTWQFARTFPSLSCSLSEVKASNTDELWIDISSCVLLTNSYNLLFFFYLSRTFIQIKCRVIVSVLLHAFLFGVWCEWFAQMQNPIREKCLYLKARRTGSRVTYERPSRHFPVCSHDAVRVHWTKPDPCCTPPAASSAGTGIFFSPRSISCFLSFLRSM